MAVGILSTPERERRRDRTSRGLNIVRLHVSPYILDSFQSGVRSASLKSELILRRLVTEFPRNVDICRFTWPPPYPFLGGSKDLCKTSQKEIKRRCRCCWRHDMGGDGGRFFRNPIRVARTNGLFNTTTTTTVSAASAVG